MKIMPDISANRTFEHSQQNYQQPNKWQHNNDPFLHGKSPTTGRHGVKAATFFELILQRQKFARDFNA
jgi:hypothetical protein